MLFYCSAVLGAQMPVNVILGGLAGAALADNRAFATLPISVIVLTSMFTAPFASWLMGRFGRRPGFLLGAVAGGTGGGLSAYALLTERFELLLLGAAFTGIYQSFQGFYRFAASDTASDDFKPKAISWVMAGGLLAALIGPEIVRRTSDLLAPTPFAGAYAALVGVNVLGAAGLAFLDIPPPRSPARGVADGRSLGEIFRQPAALVAVLCGMVAYGSMSLVMTSTSLAMVEYGFTPDHAADVVRWHVFAMFAPSFFTGYVISRLGELRVIATGLALLAACVAIGTAGVDLHRFYLALIALGLGWNFGFIGATSLLGSVHSGAERARVQGLNDFLVLGFVALSSFSSGALFASYGWNVVQLAMLPALIVSFGALIWLWLARRSVPAHL